MSSINDNYIDMNKVNIDFILIILLVDVFFILINKLYIESKSRFFFVHFKSHLLFLTQKASFQRVISMELLNIL